MSGTYDYGLVALSILVAVFAAYTALDLAGRSAGAKNGVRYLWMAGGAVALGLGIWSMHFIGMLACTLPVHLVYDYRLTLLSMALAVLGAGLGLFAAGGAQLSWRRLLASGTLTGLGVCAMHYTGMAAMHMSPPIQFNPWLVLLSGVIAIGASIVAIRLAFQVRGAQDRFPLKLAAAVVMGLAVSGMHYTGMASASFLEGSICTVNPADGLHGDDLAYTVAAAVTLVLLGLIGSAVFDRVIADKQHAERSLHRSQQDFRSAFEDAPIGVAMTTVDGRFTRVNAALCEMLGYSEEELCGRGTSDVTHPDDRELSIAALAKAVAGHERSYRIEKRYMHKSGRPVWVRVSVTLVHDADGAISHTVGQVLDITESRLQHNRIVSLNRVHALISGMASFIVRVHNRDELFRHAAKLAVEQGGFRFAWMGMVTAENDIEPVAQLGLDDGYLELIRPTLAANFAQSLGVTDIVVRNGKPMVCNDVASDPMMGEWREAALQRGYQSLVCLPVMLRGKLEACVNLYSSEAGFFDDEEMALLMELAREMAYALELIKREEEMTYVTYYDGLTGLANRTLFVDRVADHLQVARKSGWQLAVAIVDLDRFKAINDAWGKVSGDQVLLKIAERLTRIARAPTHVARISGDRFALVLPDVERAGALLVQLQETVLPQVEEPMTVFGQELRVTARIGLALFPVDGEDAESLLKNAESALKSAKRTDERVCFYTHHLSTTVRQRMDMENRLRRAIAQKEFLLHYQPKVDLATGIVSGVEALLRWENPEMGLVPPLQFVPLLEETGLIRDVGRWIVEEAAATYARWAQTMAAPPRIAVNVSPAQLKQANFVGHLQDCLARNGNVGGIDIEVTESLMLDNPEIMFATLHDVRAMGVKVFIDDFGTGYSSLSYLSRLPADALKIDRSFVIKMTEAAVNVSLVSSIISMAHSLKLKVVAEGVDSTEQLRFLRMLKCNEIQGYLFSKPVPAARLEAALAAIHQHPALLNAELDKLAA